MQRIKLGGQGLEVSAQGLGCIGMTWAYGRGDEQSGLDTIHRALDLGVTFLDTAEVYWLYTNERLVGRAVAGRRDQFEIATLSPSSSRRRPRLPHRSDPVRRRSSRRRLAPLEPALPGGGAAAEHRAGRPGASGGGGAGRHSRAARAGVGARERARHRADPRYQASRAGVRERRRGRHRTERRRRGGTRSGDPRRVGRRGPVPRRGDGADQRLDSCPHPSHRFQGFNRGHLKRVAGTPTWPLARRRFMSGWCGARTCITRQCRRDRRGRAGLCTYGTRSTAQPDRRVPNVVLCMICDPARAGEPPPAHSRCPSLKTRRRRPPSES